MSHDYEALIAIALPDDDCPICHGGEIVRELRNGKGQLIASGEIPCQCRRDKVAMLILERDSP